jgi:hypothetical protein
LALPEPSLPPFDPAKVAPLPEEADIRAFLMDRKAQRQPLAPKEKRAVSQPSFWRRIFLGRNAKGGK